MSACTGKCCAVFNYPTTPEVMRTRGWPDDAFLADMLIGLTPEQAEERVERFDVSLPEGHTAAGWAHAGNIYTCRHWDEESMLCGAYEDRPMMCRDYPYGRPCQHDCACQEKGERRAENSNPSA